MANTIDLNIDITTLQQAFDDLMNKIQSTRSELAGLKKGSEEYNEVMRRLNATENELVGVMDQLGDKIDYANVSYKNLAKTMGEINTMSKNVPLAERTEKYTKSLNSMNNQLKEADKQIGVFGRNVGSYDDALNKATSNLSRNFSMVIRELPSLANSPQQFLLAISNNLPYLAESIIEFGALRKATNEAAVGMEALTAAEGANTVISEGNTTARQVQNGATNASVAANVEAAAASAAYTQKLTEMNSQLTIAQRELNSLLSAQAIYNQALYEGAYSITLSTEQMDALAVALGTTKEEMLQNAVIFETSAGMYSIDTEAIEGNVVAIDERIAALQGEINATRENIETTKAEQASVEADTKAKLANAKATETARKAALRWGNAITIAITLFLLFYKQIIEFAKGLRSLEYSFSAGSRSLKEWMEALRGANQAAAKSATELIVYSRWATMVSKSDTERAAAAKQVVKIMKEHNIVVDEAGVKAGKYADKIDEVTAKLIKQAQAQAMMTKVTEKYQNVLDAQSKIAEREINGVTGWDRSRAALANSAQGVAGTTSTNVVTAQEIFQMDVDALKASAEKVKREYEAWLEKFLVDFDPTDLITNDKNSGGKKNQWTSYWERMIKEREASLQQAYVSMQGFTTEFLQWSDKEWWKYSTTGKIYFENMINEYAAHYKDLLGKGEITSKEYANRLLELAAKEKQYANDAALYIEKLEKQYITPDYKKEKEELEQWYLLEVQKYKDLGLFATHQSELEEQLYRKRYDLAKKYRDEFYNASIFADENKTVSEMQRDAALNDLDIWYKDTMETYRRMGIDTTNLIIEFANKQSAIRDEYRNAELEKQRRHIQAVAQLLSTEVSAGFNNTNNYLANEYSYGGLKGRYYNKTAQGAAINGGHNGANFFDNLALNERMNQMNELIAQFQISTKSIRDEIDAINSQTFETAEARENAAIEVAELEQELALQSAEFQMNMDKMVADNARELWDERTTAARTSFQIMGDLMTNIASLCEEGTEEYKGFAAAGAAMSAIASSVDAYKSVVGIPYVGPFLAPIAAASALLAGAAQIKQILATDPKGSNAGSIMTNAYVGAMPSEISSAIQATPMTTGSNEQFNMNTGNIRAYVVDRDLANGLDSYNNRNRQTTF